MIQRVDQLTAAPVKGSYYLVPAIQWRWVGFRPAMWWPVIGPKHEDAEHFKFPYQHYHLDVRFLTRAQLTHMYDYRHGGKIGDALARPLNNTGMPEGPPPPTLRKMRCSLSVVDYPHGEAIQVRSLNKAFAGAQCDRSKFGWICPHRNVHLGSMAPIDSVITCPLHGMRINAETGVVLPVQS